MTSQPASEAAVDTIVIVMSENRSFDHWLGWLGSHVAYHESGRSRYGEYFYVNANNQQTYDSPTGPQHTRHMVGWDLLSNPYQGCDLSDPNHGWNSGRAQRDLGFLAPTANDDLLPIGYYEGADLPFTQQFVKRFTTFDDYHASVLGPTYPNREYLHSAQSGGNMSNAFPTGPDGFDWPIIWDKLVAANVPVGYYYSDLPFLSLFGSRTQPYVRPIDDFYEQCAAGTLPNVVMVDPGFLGATQNDDHPLADVRAGQRFQRSVFKAFSESPQWQTRRLHLDVRRVGRLLRPRRPAPPGGRPRQRRTTRSTSPRPGSGSRRSWRRRTRTTVWSTTAPTTTPRSCDSSSGGSSAHRRKARAWPATRGSSPDAIATRTTSGRACGPHSSTPTCGSTSTCRSTRRPRPAAPRAALSPMARSVLEANDPAFDEDRWRAYLEQAGIPASF